MRSRRPTWARCSDAGAVPAGDILRHPLRHWRWFALAFVLTAGFILPWSGGAFRYVGDDADGAEEAGGASAYAQGVERVIDPIGLFEADEARRLSAAVDQARARSGARFVVLTTRGLRGEDFDRFASRFHGGWERATGHNDAAIVFVSPGDSLVGVSTGHDLPIRPTDAERQAIIERMKPLARQGEFEAAMMTGMEGIEDLLAKAAAPNET